MPSKLEQMIEMRAPGKRCILLKKTSTCTSGRLGGYIRKYLDETGKRENQETVEVEGEVQKKIKQGVNYLSKRERGQIYPFGFMLDALKEVCGQDVNSLNPLENLSNDEIAATVQRVWQARLQEKNLKKSAHKIVFSLDPELCEMMNLAGKSVDELLLDSVQDTFTNYQNEFYPGHRLGYLVGIHHDRKHIHAHVLLYPQTDQGKPINISSRSKVKLPDGSYTRVDYQGFLKDSVEKKVKQYYDQEFKQPVRSLGLPPDYKAQMKLLSLAAVIVVEKDMINRSARGEDPQKERFWQNVKAVKKQLLISPPNTLRKALTSAYERKLSDFNALTKDNAKSELDGTLTVTERIEKELVSIKRQYKNVNRNSGLKRAYQSSRAMKSEFFKVKKILQKGFHKGWTVPSFSEDLDGRWYLKRMVKQDDLGKEMRKIFEANREAFEAARKSEATSRAMKVAGFKYVRMPPVWRIKRDSLNLQMLALEQLRKKKLKEAEEELEKEKKAKERLREKNAELQIKKDILLLQTALCLKKLKDQMPLFLRQYEAWKLTGTTLPITLEGVATEIEKDDGKIAKEAKEKYEPQSYTPGLKQAIAPVEGDTRTEAELAEVLGKSISEESTPTYKSKAIKKDAKVSEEAKARAMEWLAGRFESMPGWDM